MTKYAIQSFNGYEDKGGDDWFDGETEDGGHYDSSGGD